MINAARRRPTVADQVRLYLRERIVDVRLLPNHPLSENEIANQLGLSRTPVREAFIKLEEEGLITIYPQYGTFVAPIRVSDVYDGQFVREAVESAALVRVVDRIQPSDIPPLKSLLQTQARFQDGDPAPFFEADEALHASLLRIAGHERAWHVVETAKAQHDRVRRLNVRNPLKRSSVLQEHREILDRVIAHDTAGAVAAMSNHLRGVFMSVENVMAQHPEFFVSAETLHEMPRRLPVRSRVPPASRAEPGQP
ncbi:GntR family transcriptional regulator [Roseomonas elaeocarpi]|uniref:GntR family transcriptional regulator n=1 Tax=Roseomonas elaeocarpi TaxID=907779 RepID=A0ABV6JMS3_9PROT